MTEETKQLIQDLITILDEMMGDSPSRVVADASNKLSELLEKVE